MPKDPLRCSEVAALLRVSAETVRSLVRSGELKSFKIRGQYRIRLADLEAYTAGDATPPTAATGPADDSGTAPDTIPATE